eukprot:8678641-Pyramimonas_sp.AAC.1
MRCAPPRWQPLRLRVEYSRRAMRSEAVDEAEQKLDGQTCKHGLVPRTLHVSKPPRLPGS